MDRASTDHQRLALKLLTRRMVKASGGQESAAGITRVGAKTLNDYGSREDRHVASFMALDVFLDLTLDGGPGGMIALARLCGGVFVPLPELEGDGQWAREIGDVARESGEAISKLCEALGAEGRLSAEEIRDRDLLREVHEAIEALVAVYHHLKRVEAL